MHPGRSARARSSCAASYSARFSSAGRSLATAISIPNTVEIRARTASPSEHERQAQLLQLRLRRPAAGPPSRLRARSDRREGRRGSDGGRRRLRHSCERLHEGSVVVRAFSWTCGPPARRGRGGSTSGRQSSIGPMPDSPGEAARFLTRNAVDALPEGELGAQLGRRAPAAGEARRRPHHARHPPRPHGRPAQAARVPGPGPHRGPDHRRLHGARGRPERPLVGHPAGLDRAEIDSNAATYQEQAFKVLDLDRTEVRHNGEWLDMPIEDLFRLARTSTVAQLLERDDFAKRYADGARSRSSSCSTRCSRATTRWRSGPTSSSAAPTRSSTCCSARDIQQAYGRALPVDPHHADPARHRRRAEDVQVARQLRRASTEPPEEVFGKLMRVPDAAMPTYSSC